MKAETYHINNNYLKGTLWDGYDHLTVFAMPPGSLRKKLTLEVKHELYP